MFVHEGKMPHVSGCEAPSSALRSLRLGYVSGTIAVSGAAMGSGTGMAFLARGFAGCLRAFFFLPRGSSSSESNKSS